MKKTTRKISSERWLRELNSRRTRVILETCRLIARRGRFNMQEAVSDHHFICFVEQGTLSARFDGVPFRLQPGDAAWIPPHCKRWFDGGESASTVRQHNLRFHLLAQKRQLSCIAAPLIVTSVWEIQPLLALLQDLHEHGHADAKLRLRALLTLVATGLLSHSSPATDQQRKLLPGQRQRIARCIAEHAGRELSPADLAEEIQLTPDYFTRLFRATYGLAPRYYLKRERMRLAALRLRETDLSVKQLARELGSHNVALFCRQFRDVHGCTPSVYRRWRVGKGSEQL